MPNKEQQKGIVERKQQNTNDGLLKGTNYLFVIGIDKYEDCLPLNNAVRDVKEFTQLLVEKYHFEEENIVSLFDTAATKKGI